MTESNLSKSPSEFDYNFIVPGEFLGGCDEVGRGPLAGPVVATSVCLDVSSACNKSTVSELLHGLEELGVCDSKKLSSKKRNKVLNSLGIIPAEKKTFGTLLNSELTNLSLYYSTSVISETVIDDINILNASLLAMEKSFNFIRKNLMNDFGTLLIDGNKIPKGLPLSTAALSVVKGDSKSVLIGLASIIAKEYRDYEMSELDRLYPGYGLSSHAGYPTKAHKEAIANLGVTKIHRKTFKGVKEHI